MGGALPLPPSPSTIRALVWKENNWGDEERKKLSLSDYSTQQIKYKEPKVEKEVKEVFSFKTGEKVQEQISTMFLPPYTWYKFCDIDTETSQYWELLDRWKRLLTLVSKRSRWWWTGICTHWPTLCTCDWPRKRSQLQTGLSGNHWIVQWICSTLRGLLKLCSCGSCLHIVEDN